MTAVFAVPPAFYLRGSIDVRASKVPRARFSPSTPLRSEHARPLRDLMVRLPQLATTQGGKPDLLASSPTLLVELAEYAEDCVQAIALGIAAVGNIVPYAAPEIEDGTVPMGTVNALEWLLSELGEVAAACAVLAAECRQANATPKVS